MRHLSDGLAGLERDGLLRRRRVVEGPQGPSIQSSGRTLVNFSSNDYLGLASDARLREAAHHAIDAFGVGSGASPLVSGYGTAHEDAERRFAHFAGFPRALLFASGYAANLGILATLATREAEIFSDSLNHACIIDGARLSRAKVTPYAHADVDELARAMSQSQAKQKIVATDGVFSMDGDVAPLPRILELCEAHDAWLVVDDAHGIGVLGARGRGILEHFGLCSPRIVYMATLGKALGGYGAFVGAAPEAIEWLMQRARTYVYSTALPPPAAAVASRAMDLVDEEPARIATLRERIAQFRAACASLGLRMRESISAIHPLVVGEARDAVEASRRIEDMGYLVPAIRPPTVAEGTSRLRISISAGHTREQVEGVARAIAKALAP